MEITDGAAWLGGALGAAGLSAAAWLYARISGVHGRIDTVTNHMTSEDNKLHARIDNVQEKYVRREDLDQRMQRIENGQDRVLAELKELAIASRHGLNNVAQIATRLDERVKHLEDRK